jgi:hypothetical protein
MSFKLTAEQKEKLRKLDEEMKQKRDNEQKNRARRETSSRETGIPLDIVDMDVIRVGTLLGLIKKKSIMEGKEVDTTKSLLTLLLGEDDVKVDRSKIPYNFRNAPLVASEVEKINYHQQYVHKQCTHLSNITMELIKQELENINCHINVNIESNTLDNLKTVCVETLDVLLDELCFEEEDDELWATLSLVRNVMIGIVDVCEYKKLLNEHIVRLKKAGKAHNRIVEHLSMNDVRLSLYQGCLQRRKGPLRPDEYKRLLREIELRSYMKPPELKAFHFDDIVRHCCIPSLVCLPIDKVIENGLVGPYRNNPIGYLHINTNTSPWSFYNLKNINADGARLWVLDNKLHALTDNMIATMTVYMINIFRTFYREYYGNNVFHPWFWLSSHNNHYDAFVNMMRNLNFVSNHTMFHKFLMGVLIEKSPLIPTEYDFFNHVTYYEFKITHTPRTTSFEDAMKSVFDDLSLDDINTLRAHFMRS